MREDLVDWEDPTLARWMGTITRKTTKTIYRSGFRKYALYTGMTSSQLIDEALEDQRRDPREKRDIVKQRLIGFYQWLVEEAPKKRGPAGETVGKGIASKTAHCYVNAVRSLYGTFDVYVKLKGRSRLPRAKVENKRLLLSNEDVRVLVDHAVSPRDRALILTMFQGGMDVSTLCGLKYGDVADGLERGDHPLKLDLQRSKTGVAYYTFLGRDATNSLRAYINDVKAKGVKFTGRSPLFMKLGHKALKGEGVKPHLVQAMMRELAMKTGFVDENMNDMNFNPLGPQALRESFGSIMIGKAVPDTIVDFWLGHEVGAMAEAYKRGKYEDLRRIYLEREPFISISTGGELEEKLRAEIDEKNRQLQALVNGLAVENMELKDRMRTVEGALEQELNKTRQYGQLTSKLEQDMQELIKEIQELIKRVAKLEEA